MSEEIIAQDGAKEERTLVGKIARLPHKIREKLNRRLRDNEPASVILPWLNGLPIVKKVLGAHFGGVAISEKKFVGLAAEGL